MDTHSEKPVPLDYFLKPGYIYLPEKPTVISTVLGSSVSVSLFDRSMKSGGMSHFLFPFSKHPEKTTALYGNIAVATLVRMMLENGSNRSDLEAQIFGGAYNPNLCDRDIGRDNLRTARNILKRKGVKIVSQDVGGERGRKIVFNTQTCEIITLKVDRLRDSDWYPYEGDR
ncbi:chemotaxis protein CheD [Desulfospira joergensenii]|uniref:chemotaxis protein CheD n=1 Tax=Desulfospira joergensenii TaxID=53329 RepID=UPI0003B304ED|nr:chemotaxis protein CheD [Desulfospira joergensenii]